MAIVVERALGDSPTVPTQLVELASRFRVMRILAEDVYFSGELRRVEDGYEIAYSKYQSRVRARFTIAHEIAHAILESSGPNAPKVGKELERICDMLAVEILMPRAVFWSELVRVGFSANAVLQLSRTFQTSVAATAIRCAELIEQRLKQRISVFEVHRETVTWAYGNVRRGPVTGLERVIREPVRAALGGKSGFERLWFSTPPRVGDWTLEWERLGRDDRALFLLYSQRQLDALSSLGTHRMLSAGI
ncbi:MAG TPA: ImmA/IrrE family metallo-endopeptidase [Longimicrobium sp.]